MTKLSNQEIFNKALFGIRQQNYEQSANGEACAYRGNNGTKCAVGHCIDDATAERWDSFDGSGISNIQLKHFEDYNQFFDVEQLSLLQNLQACHDNYLSVSRWNGSLKFEQEMKNIAQQFNLVYTPVNETN